MNSDSDSSDSDSDNGILPALVPRNDDDDNEDRSTRMPPLEARNHDGYNNDSDSDDNYDDNYDDTEEEDTHVDMPPLERRPSSSGNDSDNNDEEDSDEGLRVVMLDTRPDEDDYDDTANINEEHDDEYSQAQDYFERMNRMNRHVHDTNDDNNVDNNDDDDDESNDSHSNWMDFITSRLAQTDEVMNQQPQPQPQQQQQQQEGNPHRRLPPPRPVGNANFPMNHPQSGLLTMLNRVLQSPASVTRAAGNGVSVLTNGIRERWIQITMEQVEHPNQRSRGGVSIWNEGGGTAGGGTVTAGDGSGIITSAEECGVEELTNTLDSSRYCILRNKVLNRF